MTKDAMISLLQSDIVNEQTHMMYYLMNAASIQGLHRGHFQEYLADEAKSEMEHVREFTDQLVALAGPESLVGLAPLQVLPLIDPKAILQGAIDLEEDVVTNYDLRIDQCEELRSKESDPVQRAFWKNLGLFYEEQLENSHGDLNNLRQMVSGV